MTNTIQTLQQISNLLKELKTNASLSREAVQLLYAQLSKTLSTPGLTRGGTATPGGISDMINKMILSGEVPAGGRARVGGGAQLTLAGLNAVYSDLKDIQKIKNNIVAIKQQLNNLNSFTPKIDAAAAARQLSAITYTSKTSPIENLFNRQKLAFDAETEKILDNTEKIDNYIRTFLKDREDLLGGFADRLANINKFIPGGKQQEQGTQQESFEAYYARVQQEKRNRQGIENLERIKGPMDRMMRANAAKEAKYVADRFNAYNEYNTWAGGFNPVTEISTGGSVRKQKIPDESLVDQLELRKLTGSLTAENFPGIKPETLERIKKETLSAGLAVEKFGFNIDSTATKTTRLNDGTATFTVSLKDSNRGVQNLSYTLDQYGNIIEKVAKKQDLIKPTFTQASTALGENRLNAALALAQKFDLSFENLKKVKTEAKSGVSTLSFEKMMDGNIPYKLDVTVDQFGKALPKVNSRLLGFTDSIIKNTTEMFKWSIGVGLIYGAYQKLGELITQAIDNQSKLADVTITLGDSQRTATAIFNDAAKTADALGESTNDVLDSYTMAYRAVGGIKDPIEKTTAANKLLNDSTILNKLSSLDAAESIDVLSGSLRQAENQVKALYEEDNKQKGLKLNNSLEGGATLLDRWVKVTRVANVDLATLSTAFSVTAETALNAGTSIEELNAIIAVLSEKIGGLGGKETGNAVRALIGGVYQEQAAKALNQYGIAVQDADGRMRNFMDISQDIYKLYEQGIIDDTQLNKLGYVLGGGVRRGQQYVAFLKDQTRLQAIAREQQDSAGSASAALATKLSVLQTANTRVNNSFQKLAQSLGSSGGVLDLMTSLGNSTAGTVSALADLVDVLGKVTVPTALLTLASVYSLLGGETARAKLSSPFINLGNRLGAGVTGLLERSNYFKRAEQERLAAVTGAPPYINPATRIGGAFNFLGRAAPGLMATGFTAASSFAAGNKEQGMWTLAGGAIGTAIGTALGGPIGALAGGTIGSFIAQKFTQEVVDHEAEFKELFAASVKETIEEEDNKTKTQTVKEAERARITDEMEKFLGGAGLVDIQYGVLGNKDQTRSEYLIEEIKRLANTEPKAIGPAYQYLKDRQATAKQLLEDLGIAGKDVTIDKPIENTQFYKKQEEIADAQLSTIIKLGDQYRADLYKQYAAGEISRPEFQKGREQSYGIGANVVRTATAITMSGGVANIEDITKLLTEADEQDLSIITSLVADIQDLSKIMEELKGKTSETTRPFKDLEVNATMAAEMSKEAYDELLVTLDLVKQAATEANTLYPTIDFEGYKKKGMTGKETASWVEERAKKIQEDALNKQIEAGAITPEDAKRMVNDATPIIMDLGVQMGYWLAKGITDSEYITKAIEEAVANAELVLPQADIGYQFMDVTQQQFASIQGEYERIRNQILAAGGTSEESELVTFFQGSDDPLNVSKDWRIVQYLLQQILDTEEKQLDGIYNLPSGASFYVPYQAWAMDQETSEAAAEINTEGLDLAAADLSNSGIGLNTAAYHLEETVAYWYQLLSEGKVALEDIPEREREKILYDMQNGKLAPIGERYTLSQGGALPYGAPEDWLATARRYMEQNVMDYGSTVKTGERAEAPIGKDMIEQIRGEIIGPDVNELIRGKPTEESTEGINWLTNAIKDAFNKAIEFLIAPTIPSSTPGVGEGAGIGPDIIPQAETVTTTEIPQISTSLTINLQTQTQLIVDGRQLADIIKPFLYTDLVTYENTAGTVGASLG